jgi:hypothetical protein
MFFANFDHLEGLNQAAKPVDWMVAASISSSALLPGCEIAFPLQGHEYSKAWRYLRAL